MDKGVGRAALARSRSSRLLLLLLSPLSPSSHSLLSSTSCATRIYTLVIRHFPLKRAVLALEIWLELSKTCRSYYNYKMQEVFQFYCAWAGIYICADLWLCLSYRTTLPFLFSSPPPQISLFSPLPSLFPRFIPRKIEKSRAGKGEKIRLFRFGSRGQKKLFHFFARPQKGDRWAWEKGWNLE